MFRLLVFMLCLVVLFSYFLVASWFTSSVSCSPCCICSCVVVSVCFILFGVSCLSCVLCLVTIEKGRVAQQSFLFASTLYAKHSWFVLYVHVSTTVAIVESWATAEIARFAQHVQHSTFNIHGSFVTATRSSVHGKGRG